MADIVLVIKIPKETINEIENNVMFGGGISSDVRCDVTEAIVNGTPLPEGQGGLIDPAYEKMLNKWIGAEVLDRIRAEMHATAEKHEDGVYYLRDEWIDEIIDKYSEEGKA